MLFFKLSFLFFIVITTETKQTDNSNEKNDEKLNSNTQKGFLQDLDDKEWHISHLRDDFDSEGGCDGDTFENKAKKYRETLKNDAALVEYVSGDAIHIDTQDLVKGKCKQKPITILKSKEKVKVKSELNLTHVTSKTENNNNTTSDGEVKSATVSINQDKNITEVTNKRRSEYQFSSVEYYDEVPDFDHSICPNTVDVITLELDQLRNYDVECEVILEWRSLE